MTKKRMSRWWTGYVLAVVVIVLAAVLRWALDPVLGMALPYITFYPAVILVAVTCGTRPGLLATALSGLIATLLFMESRWELRPSTAADAVGLSLFCGINIAISVLGGRLRMARWRAEAEARTARTAEATLRESEHRFAAFMGHLPGAAWMKDRQGRYVYVNPEAERIFSKTMQDMQGKTDEELFPPETARQFRDNDVRALTEGNIRTTEVLRHADGRDHHSIVNKFAVPGPDGRSLYVGGVAFDITERRQAEAALRQSEERFRGTFENAAVGIAHIDPEGRCLRINRKLGEMLGYSEEELRGVRFVDITHPEDREEDSRQYGLLMRGELNSYAVEKRYIRKDGESRWFCVTRSVRRGEAGHAAYSISVVEDITARKQAEAALAESRKRLSGIIESAMDAIITVDEDQRIVMFNPAAEKMFRCPAAEVVGGLIDRLIPERFRLAHARHIRSFGETGQTARAMGHPMPISGLRCDGEEFPIEASISQVEVDGHKLFSVILRDIAERKRAEEALRAAQAELRMVTDTMAAGVTRCSRDRRYLWVSRAYAEWLGRPPQEIAGHAIVEVIGAAGYEAIRPYIEEVLSGRKVEYEAQVDFLGPGRRWINAVYTPTCTASGGVDGWVAWVTDITRRKGLEAALRESEEKFRVVAENARAAFGIVQGQRFVYANPYFAQLSGYSVEEILSMDFPQMVHPDFRPMLIERARRRQRGEPVPANYEFMMLTKSGGVRWVDFAAARIEYHGQPAIIGAGFDITERKQAEAALRENEAQLAKAKEAAETASKAKDHFLAVLSHELRTPLTPVLASVSMLQTEEGFDPDTRETLEIIRRNVELEARLIDDLLDVTRIARGKVELNRQPIPICTIIQRTAEVCLPDIEARHLHFGVDIKNPPHVVYADPGRMQQVFWNLLKNAVKFTPPGGCVGIRCWRANGHVMTEIGDSGIGIPPDVLPLIFKPFEQAERSITRQFGGLGLGLTISKALVEMHGGTIEAESEGKDKGATFRVKLPVCPVSAAEPQQTRPERRADPRVAKRRLRILLVEDHGDSVRILKRLLTNYGHDVKTTGDVATAVSLAVQGQFDLLISDLGLPDASGVDLLQELRQRGLTLPAIALSGYGQEEDIARSKAAGFAEHLVKPVDFGHFRQVVDGFASA